MERVVLKLAQRFDAHVYCLHYDPQKTFPEFRSLHVESGGKAPTRLFPIGKRMMTGVEAGVYFYTLKLKGYDLINPHSSPSEWIRKRNSPVLWYCHSPNREAYDLYDWRMERRNRITRAGYAAAINVFKSLEGQTVPNIERIVCNSKNTQNRIKKYFKRESEVISPGIDPQAFSCKSYEKFFFYPSRFIPEKNHHFALEAFWIFTRRNPGWKMVLAGALAPEHVKYVKKLQSEGVKNISIETNVSEERLCDLYSRCYCTLYPPVNEDFGLVPLESLASSKPCIAIGQGGPRETVDNSEDGFLVQTPTEMAQRMEYLALHPGICEKMGKMGRKKVLKKFTWDAFLSKFEKSAKKVANQEM
jgi:glycosyltransferase involved in cell wall biosynthesis